jgi:DNA-binding NarL/FixJ family response regulator
MNRLLLLTEREMEVLFLIYKGLGNKKIAKKLCISKNTVQTHCRHIYQKLGVKNRTEAAYYFHQKRSLKIVTTSGNDPHIIPDKTAYVQ